MQKFWNQTTELTPYNEYKKMLDTLKTPWYPIIFRNKWIDASHI